MATGVSYLTLTLSMHMRRPDSQPHSNLCVHPPRIINALDKKGGKMATTAAALRGCSVLGRVAEFLAAHEVEPDARWCLGGTDGAVASRASVAVSMREAIVHVARARRRPTEAAAPQAIAFGRTVVAGECAAVARLRAHQRDALDRVFGGGPRGEYTFARSGLVISPCGSGKTRIGVAAIDVVRRSGLPRTHALVLAPTSTAVDEWSTQLREHDAFGVDGALHVCGGGRGDDTDLALSHLRQPAVVLATYAAFARAAACPIDALDTPRLEMLLLNVWRFGIVVFDEVHVLPAPTFLRAAARLRCDAHVRLGLTADERRLDGADAVLRSYVGAMRHEVPLAPIVADGVVAPLEARLVVVPTSVRLAAVAARAASCDERTTIAVLNPQKVDALVHLLRTHAAPKALVFCDKLVALAYVRRVLEAEASVRPFFGVVSGATAADERRRVVRAMRASSAGVALFSRVGNESIDLPDVGLVVEITVLDRSVQRKTQRDGRAQRAHESKAMATTVTIVSAGFREEAFALERSDGHPPAKRPRGEERRAQPPPTRAWTAAPSCPWSEDDVALLVDKGRLRAVHRA